MAFPGLASRDPGFFVPFWSACGSAAAFPQASSACRAPVETNRRLQDLLDCVRLCRIFHDGKLCLPS
jgi:hypothetical protein